MIVPTHNVVYSAEKCTVAIYTASLQLREFYIIQVFELHRDCRKVYSSYYFFFSVKEALYRVKYRFLKYYIIYMDCRQRMETSLDTDMHGTLCTCHYCTT